ncbi:hypothetical protein D3C72_1620440 [compost metagenome]
MRNGAKKLGRDLLIHARGVIHRTRQRRKFHHFYLVLTRHFTDVERDIVNSFCHDVRSFRFVGIVFQRHRKVCWVGDDHVRFRNGAVNLSHCHLALKLTDAPLNLRVPVVIFVLFLHLLLGHAHFFCEHEFGERHVEQGKNHYH